MTLAQREMAFFMAKTCDSMRRYDGVVNYLKKAAGINSKFETEEVKFFASALKRAASPLRNHLIFIGRVLSHQRNKGAVNITQRLETYQMELQKELKNFCYDIGRIIDKRLFPSAKSFDDQILYLTLQGDLYRYYCEVAPNHEQWEANNSANECYDKAVAIARDHLMATNATRLNAILNMTVFMAEILERRKNAIEQLKETIDAVDECMSTEGIKELTPEAQNAIQLMKQNIVIWENYKE